MKVIFREITDIRDPLLLPWLDLYETAFPEAERSLVSSHLEDLLLPTQSEEVKHRLVCVDEQGQFLGMARYSFVPNIPLIYLIYLAVVPEQRSAGIGGQLFEEVRRHAHHQHPSGKIMAWEVERPDAAAAGEEARLSERRIQFYRRLGGKLVAGIDYAIQNRPELPVVPLHLMALPLSGASFDAMPVEEVLSALRSQFNFTEGEQPVSLE